jgi:hypothetical protein
MRRVVTRALVTVVAASTIGVLAAQSRETLETKVTVSDTEITFKWSKKHPWDAVLVANGVALFGEYRASKGAGLECLQANAPGTTPPLGRAPAVGVCYAGNAVLRKEDRTIVFRLPATLTAEPLGPVCLQLRLPDGRLLPVRQASKTGEDTARFHVEEWSRQVTDRSKAARLDGRRAELQAGIATQAREITEQESSNQSKGWTSVAACSTQTGGTVEIARSGRPIAPPNEQDAVARQVCVARVLTGVEYVNAVKPPGPMVARLDAVDEGLRAKWLQLRGDQLLQFLQDWNKYAPTIAAYKGKHATLPHFGTYNDRIPIQSLAQLSLALIEQAEKSKTAPDPQNVFGYAGATAEAYNRCVTDGKEQLALNYTQSIELSAAVEALPDRLRQQAVQACQAGVARLTTMRGRLAGFEKELTTVDSEIRGLSSTSVKIRPRELNAVSCAP